MTKTIKVSQETYDALVELMEKRESFSQVIDRTIAVYRRVLNISTSLGPAHHLQADNPPGREG